MPNDNAAEQIVGCWIALILFLTATGTSLLIGRVAYIMLLDFAAWLSKYH